MENSIKIIKQIETTHKGLGVPLLFGNLCNFANVSCFFIGDVGTGKGTLIKSIKRIDTKENYDMNIFTMNITTLIKELGDVKSEKIVWRIPEWSTLQPYHRNVFLTIGSQLISDHNFNHISRTKDDEIGLHLEDITLCCYVGIQPLKLSRMMSENENWESISKDRFLKFALINPLRSDTNENEPKYDFKTEFKNNQIIPIESPLTITKWTLTDQASEERLILYCRKMITAYAQLEGFETVTPRIEIEFHKLFYIYMKLYSLMVYTTNIDKEDRFSVGALRLLSLIVKHHPISLYDVLSKFKYKDIEDESFRREVLSIADVLVRNKLITVTNSEPTFHLSPDLEHYYEWYKEISE